jgi:hypothetical protein
MGIHITIHIPARKQGLSPRRKSHRVFTSKRATSPIRPISTPPPKPPTPPPPYSILDSDRLPRHPQPASIYTQLPAHRSSSPRPMHPAPRPIRSYLATPTTSIGTPPRISSLPSHIYHTPRTSQTQLPQRSFTSTPASLYLDCSIPNNTIQDHVIDEETRRQRVLREEDERREGGGEIRNAGSCRRCARKKDGVSRVRRWLSSRGDL